MAATVAMVEGCNHQSHKYSASFRAARRANLRRSSSRVGVLDSDKCEGGDCKKTQAEESILKVMFLNCWAQG